MPLLNAAVTGRSVRLVPVSPDDVPSLYALCVSGSNLSAWRYRGATVSPTVFASTLWNDVLTQFMIVSPDGQILGLVVAYGAESHHAKVAVTLTEEAHGAGIAWEGPILFVDFLFDHWPFRKLYVETTQTTFDERLRSLTRFMRVEGVLREHEFVNGEYEDQRILALYREDWRQTTEHLRYLPNQTVSSHRPVGELDEFVGDIVQRLSWSPAINVDKPLSEQGLDSLDMLAFLTICDDFCPGWELPSTAGELRSLCLREVHHFLSAISDRLEGQSDHAGD